MKFAPRSVTTVEPLAGRWCRSGCLVRRDSGSCAFCTWSRCYTRMVEFGKLGDLRRRDRIPSIYICMICMFCMF